MRAIRFLAGAAAVAVLAGCAAMYNLGVDVSTHGQWPSQRAPGTFQFERLPSQQSQPERQAALEAAARGALERAGFRLAPDGVRPDVVVQLGTRLNQYDRGGYYYDGYLWSGAYWGPRAWRYGPYPYYGVGFPSWYYDFPSYQREVAMLIRDRESGTPLYEARATADPGGFNDQATIAAMYDAALMDFPTPSINPRRVVMPMAPH
jgi:hypothetical protein